MKTAVCGAMASFSRRLNWRRVPAHVWRTLVPAGASFRPVGATAASAAAEPRRRIRPRLVYGVAAVLLLIAAILSVADVGEQPGRLSDWQAFVLGVTQGLTELLPISSSGHLILVPWLADWHYLEAHPSFNKTFDVALHLGTLVAVVAYFWADVVRYVVAWVPLGRPPQRPHRRRAHRLVDLRGHDPGRDRRRARRGADREPPRPALADRDLHGGLRRPALARRPPARRSGGSGPRLLAGARGRRLADPGADARGLALGDHDHDGPLPRGSTATRLPASRSCC